MLSFEEIRKNVEKAISELRFDYPPKSLYDPIEYTLALGGKRIRPALVLMATMVEASLMPFKCCTAPEMPQAMYRLPVNFWPDMPT